MRLLLCLLLSFNFLQAKPEHYFSVCTIFQNEGRFLKEWIEYHRLQGAAHFYLYNNKSTDDYMSVLGPYVEEGIVDVIDWPGNPDNFHASQSTAFNHCIQHCLNNTKTHWLGIIDIDEFIVPVKKESVKALLSDYDKKIYVGAVRMNWQLYGTSFLKEMPEGKLVTECFTLKAPDYYDTEPSPNHTLGKCIVRPEAVKEYYVHRGDLKEKYHVIPYKENARKILIEDIRLNHYWCRGEDFFEIKVGRRLQTRDPSHVQVMLQKMIDFNQVEDKIIFRFLPALRERMR